MVVRQWPAQRRRALERAKRHLRRGDSFYISIEGYRSPGGLLPYRTGPVRLALAGGATLVPLVIRGAEGCLPYGEWRIAPGLVRIVAAERIPTRGLGEDRVAELVGRLRSIAEDELAQQLRD